MKTDPFNTLMQKRTLVTGAGSGIGRAICLELASRGAFVSLAGRDQPKLEAVTRLIPSGRSDTWSLDLGDPTHIARFGSSFIADGRGLDVLVHSAGVYDRSFVSDTVPEDLSRVLSVNLIGPMILTSLLLPLLRSSNGDIVFVNSSVAIHASAGLAAYAMSKAGLRALADALRAEVNPQGVRVLSIFAGRTATLMLVNLVAAEGGKYAVDQLLQPEDIARTIADAISLPRTAEVTDIHIRPRSAPTR